MEFLLTSLYLLTLEKGQYIKSSKQPYHGGFFFRPFIKCGFQFSPKIFITSHCYLLHIDWEGQGISMASHPPRFAVLSTRVC